MVRACISWINFHEPLSEFNRKNVSRSYQTGVPNGAARQNTRSSYRIWASWEKLHWLISWLENLNERLASWKYGIFMPFSGWIKRYIFSPGNRTVFLFSWILGWAKQVSAHENHPTRTVEMTPFASTNGNLFGCVSKTSCCECLVKDTRSEKMTRLSQAPLTALFLVVSLSILFLENTFVCSSFNTSV